MIYLLTASIVWAFSFGLIQHKLVGLGLDPFLVAWLRLILSLLVLLPFFRMRRLTLQLATRLILLGVVQYGIMYVSYLKAYHYLASHEVALFTIFTPLFVTLIDDAFERRFRRFFFLTAVMAVAGTALIVAKTGSWRAAVAGLLLLQVSNASFAFGQVVYRRLMNRLRLTSVREAPANHEIFALLYLGGVAFATLPVAITGSWSGIDLSTSQVLTLLYLGIIPSGLCFYLWNVGARKTEAGTLAVMNNAKIPLAVMVSLFCFGESADSWRLLV
ncbi:MAG: EamA family transporter, partial [Verrucomicrobia bacterium]|nr:EamA family transporter [Verrucomicrobiota bacterium]